ncbi:hypothetical protein Fcan01_22495, partial [Folsomia candida]
LNFQSQIDTRVKRSVLLGAIQTQRLNQDGRFSLDKSSQIVPSFTRQEGRRRDASSHFRVGRGKSVWRSMSSWVTAWEGEVGALARTKEGEEPCRIHVTHQSDEEDEEQAKKFGELKRSQSQKFLRPNFRHQPRERRSTSSRERSWKKYKMKQRDEHLHINPLHLLGGGGGGADFPELVMMMQRRKESLQG